MILTIDLNPSIDKIYSLKDFQKGKLFETKNIQYTAGGKGLNIAKVIKAFNEPVIATGFLGGRNGEYIKEELNVLGIKHSFVSIKEETRNYLAILSDDGKETEILEIGPSISGAEVVEFYELYSKLIKEVDIICAAGSLPPGLPVEIYRNLIILAKEAGKKFFLYTNGDELKHGIEAGPFLIKSNKKELENIIGFRINSQRELIQTGKYLMENDVEIVIISLDKSGYMVFYDGCIYEVNVPKTKIVNSKGSGAAMIGGFIASQCRDYDFEFTLKVAAACGKANAIEAETDKVDMNNIKRIMNDIIIDKSRL